ncbi:response regulator [Altererythrobacter luteolus]|uniref:Response regulator n=1 Tax=Pontixanthobacter luteolus TaxID=295089 RepID=A0A6I4V1W9_9SPHN|nr:response regulator [Pontixanthobacter luteolus]MXP48299.1 response regulator [Pontixanthobacter luteolus]
MTAADKTLALVVDDEALIAYDLSTTVESLGYDVMGPALSLDEAMSLVDEQTPDVALLDINIAGDLVWPLARRLITTDCQIVFISAKNCHAELAGEFSGAQFIDKPASQTEICEALSTVKIAG